MTVLAQWLRLPTTVSAVCASVDGSVRTMITTSLAVVCTQAQMVTVCVRKDSPTWPSLREADSVGVSVLASDQGAIARALRRYPADPDTGMLPTVRTYSDAVFVDRAAATFHCTICEELAVGDRYLAVLTVVDSATAADRHPLTIDARWRR